MSFEPQIFFIGLMDFFSILPPGALLACLLMGEVGPVVLGDRYVQLVGAQAWAAFLFASHLFGHLVFLLGSWVDDFYDWPRRHTLIAQIARLPPPWPPVAADRPRWQDQAASACSLQSRSPFNRCRWPK